MTGALPASYPHRLTWWVFLILLVSGAVFIVATSGQLPSLVASHFDAAGRPNGFMSRGGYVLAGGLIAFLMATLLWVAALMFAFCRPACAPPP